MSNAHDCNFQLMQSLRLIFGKKFEELSIHYHLMLELSLMPMIVYQEHWKMNG